MSAPITTGNWQGATCQLAGGTARTMLLSVHPCRTKDAGGWEMEGTGENRWLTRRRHREYTSPRTPSRTSVRYGRATARTQIKIKHTQCPKSALERRCQRRGRWKSRHLYIPIAPMGFPLGFLRLCGLKNGSKMVTNTLWELEFKDVTS